MVPSVSPANPVTANKGVVAVLIIASPVAIPPSIKIELNFPKILSSGSPKIFLDSCIDFSERPNGVDQTSLIDSTYKDLSAMDSNKDFLVSGSDRTALSL